MHGAWSYGASTGIVTGYIPGKLTVTMPSRVDHGFNMAANKGSPYYLIGAYNALDTEREWFYDSDSSLLYLWPPGGGDPSNVNVEARSSRQYGINLNGKSFINIANIGIHACAVITDSDSTNNVISNLNAKYVTHYWMRKSYTELLEAQRSSGIVLNGSNNTLKNSRVDYSAANGVTLLGTNNTVQKCEISNVNYIVSECGTISNGSLKSSGNRIISNKLYNSGRSLLLISKAQNLKVLYNEIYNSNYGGEVWDLGSIYTIATDSKESEIAYNRIYNGYYAGVYLDTSSHNYHIHHNVIWDIKRDHWRYGGVPIGIHMNTPSTGNIICHNTLPNTWTSVNASFEPRILEGTVIQSNLGDWTSRFDGIYGLVAKDNINTLLGLGTGFPHYAKDPYTIYLDYDNYDFRLRAGTVETPNPAVDAGQELGYLNDILGHPVIEKPDIGAYEYVEDSVSVLETVISENWDLFVEFPQEDGVGNPLSYSPGVSGLPQGAAFYSDSGIFAWRPWYDQAGTYESIFQPSLDSVTWEKVTITVEDVLLQNWYALWLATHDEMLIR